MWTFWEGVCGRMSYCFHRRCDLDFDSGRGGCSYERKMYGGAVGSGGVRTSSLCCGREA